jgi:hypothetical protein
MFIDQTHYIHPWTDGVGGTGIYTYPWNITTTNEPTECGANLHVFGCDHATKCKCGKTRRKPEPPTCAHCGKEHT